MYTVAYVEENKKSIHKAEKLEIVYDANDNVLFGANMTKGKVTYEYLPAEKMVTGRPYIVDVGVNYDGVGNADLPDGSVIKSFSELPAMFPDNSFAIQDCI